MFNKVAESVVQGILIAAICFCAATVWNAFQTSTDDLRIAKGQLNAQMQRNQQLIEFNRNQKQMNQELLNITDQQSEDLRKLTKTLMSLYVTVQKLTEKSQIKADSSVTGTLSEIEKAVDARKSISDSVQQQQQQQHLIYGQMQQQQQQQQQVQQSWL